jgi:glycosyltransferase involved in cell wall biosynthesis
VRVALIAPFGLRPKGTTSARVLPIGKVLGARGADVRVIVPPWDDQERAGERWTEDGVEVIHTRLAPGPLERLVVIWDLLREIRSFQPDVVHAFKPIGYSGAIASRLAGRSGRSPLVVVDADDLEGPGGWAGRRGLGLAGRLRGAQERRTLRAAPLVTVASAWLADFVDGLGVPPERVLRLPNGVASSELPVPRSRPNSKPGTASSELVWYTRFTEAAPERAARLLAPLLRAHPDLGLTVLGDELGAGDRAALENTLTRESVGARVRWLGYEQAEGDDYLVRAGVEAVAVYPMDDDAVNRARCPSKVPQLMALGIPIVAEAVGEIPTYLAGFERECLAAPGDTAAFCERVDALLTSRPRRASLAKKLQRAADRWRWDNVAAGLLPWYEQEVGRAPAG